MFLESFHELEHVPCFFGVLLEVAFLAVFSKMKLPGPFGSSFFSLRRFFLAVLSLLWLSLKASFIQFIKLNRVLSDSVKQSGRLGFSEDADSVAALTM